MPGWAVARSELDFILLYDLAIVTRGVGQPFQVAGGLDRFVEAYLKEGGQELSKQSVYVNELMLALGRIWFCRTTPGVITA